MYRVHIVLWLNTALNRQLDFDVYRGLAERCNIVFHYPGKPLQCYTANTVADCAPQFITCCEPFAALQNFQQVFPDSANARLLALYFSLQRTERCTPVNLPAIDYLLPYDSIVRYFQNFKLASGYTITVSPDSLIHYSISNTGTCNATALNFKQAAISDALYVVCRKPLQPLFPIDGNSCISEQISTALFNAHSDYLEYKEKLKRDYRDAYYSKCLSITPQLTATAVYEQQPEYHYTLYYYDQSGTLVKTIPPAGVQPVDEQPDGASRMKRIKNFRLADKDYCYEYGDAPFMNGSASITITDNAALHQNQADFTIEAFVNFSSLSGTQTILVKQSVNTADNTIDGYKLYLQNGRLQVDFAAHGQEWWIQTLNKLVPYPWPAPYATQPPVIIPTKVQVPVLRSLYRSLTAQITSDISELINAGQWVAISIEGTADRNDPIHIYINGSLVNSSLVDNKYNYTPAASPAITSAEIAAGTTEWRFTFNSTAVPLSINNTVAADLVIGAAGDGLLGSIKQVRLYQRTLPAAEIRNNAFNSCLIPQTEAGLVLWLPLHKEETAGSCLDRINQVATNNLNTVFSNAFQPVYPSHRFPTHYYYNSLAGITRQASPDAGEINFYYDLPGRLIASQNAEQRIAGSGNNNGSYSYTKYDPLGRIIEAGEKSGAAAMTNAIAFTNAAIKNSLLSNWMASGNDANMIQTIYDEPDKTIVPNKAITANQEVYTTSRKRVVAMVYRNKESAAKDYNNATHYQYDISGNVKRLWQEHRQSVTGEPVNLLKTLEYDYDLLSGKVNQVRYQPGKGDQFVYKYEYDPENRLLQAFSGRDKNTLQQDAGYRYYGHGPLARMETGDATTGRIVQGSDYAYTLQGWLKGVNGVQLSPDRSPGAADAGGDGVPLTAGGIHAIAGADALAYTLGYYHNDYVPIGASAAAAFDIAYHSPASASAEPTGKELFNGNIAYSVYGIAGITEGRPLAYTYGYDQLNRLSERRAHTFYTAAAGGWNNGMALPDHKESFTYDANGNILGLFRNGTREGERPLAMDQLFYHYYYYTKNNTRQTYQPGKPVPADAWMLTNQLAHISDAVSAANYPPAIDPDEQDVDDQTTGNYAYNRIGNLVSDKVGGILNIGWTVYGKISRIDKADGTSVVYDYDAAGNRIQKEIISGKAKTISYYVRDVIGNIIAVYGWQGRPDAIPQITTAGNGVKAQTWNEQHLYGSSRLGMWKSGITVPDNLDLIAGAVQIGSKFFELTNHLGNVLAVVSDKKLAVPSVNNPVVTDHYTAELISASDYTSFGMRMVGRQYNVTAASYHYGFNGKENDNEAAGEGNQQDYGMRVYDPRVGRFLSVDLVTSDYPMLTPYQFASNSPVSGIDLDGLEYSPAGKLGILAIDNTAVQLYPNHPTVIEQQRADAPMVLLSHQMAHIHPQPSFLSVQWKPANAFEQVRHEINKEDWYDRDGYKADGTAKPLTKLAGNKTWNSFANNLALPFFDIASYTGGEGEIQALIKGASKLATREEIVGLVDALFSSTKAVKELDAKAVIGYRGSLATGIKYKTGGPFNPHDFDVDAFIVSNKMAKQIGNVTFRSGRRIEDLKEISNNLENIFKQIPGYRTSTSKPFTFRIYTTQEFKSIVIPKGYKSF